MNRNPNGVQVENNVPPADHNAEEVDPNVGYRMERPQLIQYEFPKFPKNRLTVRRPPISTAEPKFTRRVVGVTTLCDYYTADTTKDIAPAFAYAWRKAHTADNNEQLCVAFASMLMMLSPELSQPIFSWAKGQSIELNKVMLPKALDENLEEVDDLDYPQVLVMFGCCCLMLFKNIKPASHCSFFLARIKAMKGSVGIHDDTEIKIPFTAHQASIIRTIMGASTYLKSKVIGRLIKTSCHESKVGHLAKYLFNTLAWIDMGAFVFIYDTLILTRSPVLTDFAVMGEVANYADAYRVVSKAEYPQYFRYHEGFKRDFLVQRSQFPTLAAVATALKERSTKNNIVQQFAMPQNTMNNGLVKRLVSKHCELVLGINLVIKRDAGTAKGLAGPKPIDVDEEDANQI